MISNSRLCTVLSTTDLAKAQKFYEETLGLKLLPARESEEGGLYFETEAGDKLYIYERPDPPKAENTAACFQVSDIEAEMADLTAAGVKFEEYDFPGLKTENGIATLGKLKSAWFLDPDGNILCLNQIG